MRPISLAVDVTNHVLLELGQPLHAFDLSALSGEIVVRRAAAGEKLGTLDGQMRVLDPEDLVITDDSGPIALAGVMGGAATEVGKIAAWRDDSGTLHECSAVCTHMKCIVDWNTAEKSWDCPCHGSRFAPTGEVIAGPATVDLPRAAH